jgi:hypothetical protein
MYLVFSAFTSRPTSLLESITAGAVSSNILITIQTINVYTFPSYLRNAFFTIL